MRLIFVSVLGMSALCVPACADPLQLMPAASMAMPSAETAVAPDAHAIGGQRYSPSRSNLGGGFIEFLFGSGQQSLARTYQQIAPDYQADPTPLPRAMRDGPIPAYAPATLGDMQHPPVDPKYDRQVVAYDGREQVGTVIIDTPNRFLYLVEDGGKALRYGIGVGRPGFAWAGVKTITAKREWPDWIPPEEMIERRPDLPRYMAGGPENPLGARALYLGSTLYRIHGSNEPWTIGTQVSSGCIRMRNDDVTDLYDRVKVGTKVIVI